LGPDVPAQIRRPSQALELVHSASPQEPQNIILALAVEESIVLLCCGTVVPPDRDCGRAVCCLLTISSREHEGTSSRVRSGSGNGSGALRSCSSSVRRAVEADFLYFAKGLS